MFKRMFKLYGIVLIFMTISFLNGCSTTLVRHSSKDGPPPFDVDVSNIPNAVPRCEARSHTGNKSQYDVLGRRYCVMKSSKNYRECGVASWYGTKFHARSTSSGERYNMLAMTAAHKSLPLPTYVEVTNLSNHKTIIVKVNDRGPFEANRIIDLSYVAAKKLGMLARGTANVEIKALDPNVYWAEQRSKTRNTLHPVMVAHSVSHHTPSSSPHIFLQVGLFQNRGNAQKLQSRLATLLHSPVSIADAPHQTKKMYRVQVGPFKDIATAGNISHRLKAIGFHSQEIR